MDDTAIDLISEAKQMFSRLNKGKRKGTGIRTYFTPRWVDKFAREWKKVQGYHVLNDQLEILF